MKSKKTFPKIAIKEAIEYFNNNRLANITKMTQAGLARNMPGTATHKAKREYMWNFIHGKYDCPANWLQEMALTLNVTTDFLLRLTTEPAQGAKASFWNEGKQITIEIK